MSVEELLVAKIAAFVKGRRMSQLGQNVAVVAASSLLAPVRMTTWLGNAG